MKESIRQILDALTRLDGPPGFEQPVVRYLVEQFEKTDASVTVDTMGNVYAVRGQPVGKPHLMIVVHSDEIGAIVRHIDAEGFLQVDPLGGITPSMMVGRRVRVAGKPGVVGAIPGHLPNAEGRQMVVSVDQLYIDVGVDSAEEVAKLGIRVGSAVTYDSPLQSLSNPDRLSGKAIDNRLGCAVLLQLFREIQSQEIAGRLTGVAAVQEEVGLRGATVAARRTNPDYALVVDTFPIGDTPDVAPGRMPGALGSGPVIVLAASGRFSGHLSHPKLIAWLEAAAQEARVPLQRVTSIGFAVTDAAAVYLRRDGIPTGVLGLPRRYAHTPICTFDLNDAVGAVRVLQEFVASMDAHVNPSFL